MGSELKKYLALDLKSFYASVECIERGLDPLTTNLVVADLNHTEKTICLAATPTLKSYGISGRDRYYEVLRKVREINKTRLINYKNSYQFQNIGIKNNLTYNEYCDTKIKNDISLALDFITAPPQMAKYMEVSSKIYEVYLKYFSKKDIHVYSIDEVFIDITPYLDMYDKTTLDLTRDVIYDVLKTTGITATAGIGTNLYLCKIAMDIDAKKKTPDKYGARISELDEMSYRERLWSHTPLTDFWRIGPGIARRMSNLGCYTMGDIARLSITNEDLIYSSLGINAELLIDHAWGWEPVGMSEIKAYKPVSNSLGTGQVLHSPYDYKKTRIIVREMIELLILDLYKKNLVTDQIVMTIGYDISNFKNKNIKEKYIKGASKDWYGRHIPAHSHGTQNLEYLTSSTNLITIATMQLYDRIIKPDLLVRRINISANHVVSSVNLKRKTRYIQQDIFKSIEELNDDNKKEKELEKKNEILQKTTLEIQAKYGKNALLKATSLKQGATTIERNNQIGGHRA